MCSLLARFMERSHLVGDPEGAEPPNSPSLPDRNHACSVFDVCSCGGVRMSIDCRFDSVWIDVFRACIQEARFTLELKVLYERGKGTPVCAVSSPGSWSGATGRGVLGGAEPP